MKNTASVFQAILLVLVFLSDTVLPGRNAAFASEEEISRAASSHQEGLKLWYDRPAAEWHDALPLGNGRMGAMVFGDIPRERLQLNEDTLWSGGPHDYNAHGASRHLARVRELIFEGKVKRAEKIINESMLGDSARLQAYQPLGDLYLDFPGHEGATGYRRELDLDAAVSRVRYTAGDAAYTRQVFSSSPDQVIVVHMTCDRPGRLSFDVSMDSPQPGAVARAEGSDTLLLGGRLGPRKRPGVLGRGGHCCAEWDGPGMAFEARVLLRVEGGEVDSRRDRLRVRQADSATLLVAMATSFKNYRDMSGDPTARTKKSLLKVAPKSFEELLRKHVADHRRLFRRVTLDLGASPKDDQPTDRRIDTFSDGRDPQLAALYFQFGRYLLIASSRPGTQPANLQGIWNDQLWPAWGSKWTLNINAQMNYWPAEVCNLAECHDPLFDLIEDLRETGTRTASVYYGCRGFLAHHNSDLWRAATPVDRANPGMWTLGAAWLCMHLWEHYRFGGDDKFLRDRGYPLMKDAALFFVDFLVEAPEGTRFAGSLVTNPSTSPENNYLLPDGTKTGFGYAATMDIQLIQDLFESCIEAAEILGVDPEFREKLAALLNKLPPVQISEKTGRLQEWIEDHREAEPDHRHLSHLYGLYPGDRISLEKTPRLAAAARKSLLGRGPKGGMGWSYGWRIGCWARLHEPQYAYANLAGLLTQKTLPNLFDNGPPFQIDGNFGGTAGIAEMLLQSHTGEIVLLPGLPPAWPEGRVKGLRGRGGFELDVSWSEGRLTEARVTSFLGKICRLCYGETKIEFNTKAGGTYRFDAHLQARSSGDRR